MICASHGFLFHVFIHYSWNILFFYPLDIGSSPLNHFYPYEILYYLEYSTSHMFNPDFLGITGRRKCLIFIFRPSFWYGIMRSFWTCNPVIQTVDLKLSYLLNLINLNRLEECIYVIMALAWMLANHVCFLILCSFQVFESKIKLERRKLVKMRLVPIFSGSKLKHYNKMHF